MAHKVGFREMLKRSLMLDKADAQLYDKLPSEIFEGIFQHNFNGNLNTAERVLFNRYGKLQKIETEKLEREKRKIENLSKAANKIVDAINNDRPVLFVTDADNDGSLSQSILIEYLKIIPEEKKKLIHIEYSQPIGKSHGITYEIVEKAIDFRKWKDDDSFLIVTADNGINNRDEQANIQARWKNTDLIITDHHLPDADSVVLEDDRTIIFNPKNKPTDYFKKKNISGANVLGVLLTETYKLLNPEVKEPNYSLDVKTTLENIRELGYWANYLDYANADLADMPTRPYIIDKASSLSPILNVSNSMANFVTGNFSDELLEKVETSSNGEIKKDWLKEQIEDVAALNVLSHKLLNLYKIKQDYKGPEEEFDAFGNENDWEYRDNFYGHFAKEIQKEDMSISEHTGINDNYIQQLRPIIFNLSAIDNKDKFDTDMAKNMTEIFETLKRKERILLDKARQVDLLIREELEHSAISYPIDADLPKVFNRKFLGKAYNEANNGFNLIVDKVSDSGVSGSMRTLYPITQILEGREEIEEKLGVVMSFKGHEQAAGFFIDAKDEKTKITGETVKEINQWLNKRIGVLKANELNPIQTVEVDFSSVALVDQINSAVKAQLAGMKGIPTIIKFSPDVNNEVWLTDPKTTGQASLKDMIANKKYGYQSIKTDLNEGAFIAPVEMLRKVIDGGYKDALKLAYLGQGAFIAQQVTDPSTLTNLFSLSTPNRDQQKLTDYYKENFTESNFMDLDRDYFKELPYFKYNKFGEKEFKNWESVIIKMLDKTHQDVLAVVDTEGTGLGKAPHCLNIGGTNIMVDEKSGEKVDAEDFAKRYFKTSNGYDVSLSDEQLSALIRPEDAGYDLTESLEEGSDFDNKKMTLLYVVAKDGLADTYIYPGNYKELKEISNMKVIRQEVEFDTSRVYETEDGETYELTEAQIASLRLVQDEDIDTENELAQGVVLYGDSRFGEAYIYSGDIKDLKFVDVIEEEEKPIKEVIINRQIKGSAFAMLIKGDDFAMPKEFEKLTGISQAMLNELGMSRDQADKLMTDYYSNLKNTDGNPARIVFQAHNMPYDKGVVSANFNEFDQLMNQHVISDTAKIARTDKLAYDDTPVCSFEDIPGIPPRVYFYDSPYSEYSMTTFLDRIKNDKKGGVFPDTTARYLLRYSMDNEKFSLIDRKSKEEFILEDATLENMSTNFLDENDQRNPEGCKYVTELPNNALKYSVERMSSRAMIRNIILSQDFKVNRVLLNDTEKLFANSLNFFQDNYHFDSSKKDNIQRFTNSMSNNDSSLAELVESVNLEKFTDRFLKLNKKTQAMFHDGWIYEKVLAQYEPSQKDLTVTKNVLEQINYLTDVPKDRIKEVLKSVVMFKRNNKIDHALVHEQHNNIIQKSEDGMGLSDTAYECVLPQLLGMMKHYNSYKYSVDAAADRMIFKNFIGSMVQTVLKTNNDETFSMDSYSYKQMMTFTGDNKTRLVQKAEDYSKGLHMTQVEGEEPVVQEIKFKLSSGVLPPYSAVYAKTDKHIEQDKIYDYSEKLNFVLMNEQIGFAADALRGLDPLAREGIIKVVSENSVKSEEYKKELLTDFSIVEFQRRDELRKKIADGLMDALDTGSFKVKARAVITKEIVKETEFFAREFAAAIKRVVPDSNLIDVLESAVQMVKEAEEKQALKAAKPAKASKSKAKAKDTEEGAEQISPESEIVEIEFKSVRDQSFLPDLKIERREPLKVLLDNGMEFTFSYMKKILKSGLNKVLGKDINENSIESDSKVEPVSVSPTIEDALQDETVAKKPAKKRKP